VGAKKIYNLKASKLWQIKNLLLGLYSICETRECCFARFTFSADKLRHNFKGQNLRFVKQSQSWLEDLRTASRRSQPWLQDGRTAAKTPEYWLEEKVLLDQKTPSRHTQPWVKDEEVRTDARRFYPGFSLFYYRKTYALICN
jgi:hypothetical protein